jgi:catechol 2,3-dioxygenase-like lactoylglutathione lyase family enzyme
MIDHIGITVSDFDAAKNFYQKTLASLGLKPLIGEDGHYFGFGTDHPVFWIAAPREGNSSATRGAHYAFAAANIEEVDQFHKAGIEAGGKDNGAPGYRAEYSPDYYAAFICDPEGNNVEAVFHDPAKK